MPGDHHKYWAPVEWYLWLIGIVVLWFSELKSVSSCFSNFWQWTAFYCCEFLPLPIMWCNIAVHETDVNKCFFLPLVSAGVLWCLCELTTLFILCLGFLKSSALGRGPRLFQIYKKAKFSNWLTMMENQCFAPVAVVRVENRKKGKGCIFSPYHVGAGELLRVPTLSSSPAPALNLRNPQKI